MNKIVFIALFVVLLNAEPLSEKKIRGEQELGRGYALSIEMSKGNEFSKRVERCKKLSEQSHLMEAK